MADASVTGVNPDLNALHDSLIAANQQLSASLDTITDPKLAQSVVTEMREIVHRIDLVQSLLFTAASARIAGAVSDVQSANAKLTASLATIQSITTLVTTVTDFLTLVDKAIDLAKTVAA
jgi:hypothetical protein